MAEYEEGLALLQEHLAESTFESQAPERVERAERALGVQFPPTYRRFLHELGAGGIGAFDIYGVVDDDLDDVRPPGAVGYTLMLRREGRIADDIVVIYGLGQGSDYGLATSQAGPDGEAPVVGFTPGLSDPSDDHEVIFPDFGCFFLDRIQFGIESLGH
jgi:hypothetical protein